MNDSLLTSAHLHIQDLVEKARHLTGESLIETLNEIRRASKALIQYVEASERLFSVLAVTSPPVEEPGAVAFALAPEPPSQPEIQRDPEHPTPQVAKKQKPLEVIEEKPAISIVKSAPVASPAQKKQYRAKLTDLQKRHNQLLNPGEHGRFAYKALLCSARAVLERADRDVRDRTEIEPELSQIMALYQQRDGSEFFGLNMGRHHSPEVWEALDEGFQLLEPVAAALDELQELGDERDTVPEEILNDLAAAIQLLPHLNEVYGLGVFEPAVGGYIDHFREMYAEGRYFPALMVRGERALPLEKIQKMAREFGPGFRKWTEGRKKNETRTKSKETLAALIAAVQDTANLEEYEEQIRRAAEQALESGIPASNKELVRTLLPYRALFEHETTGLLKPLKSAMDKEFMLQTTKGMLGDPPESTEPDAEHDRKVGELRPLLEGKTLLLVGGNKGQKWRMDDLQKTLGLKEILWPELEDASNVNTVMSFLAKADVAAQLIRWSRHAYGNVLTAAREQGKAAVRIKSGLGTRRIVHDLYEQLVGNQKA